MCRLTGFIENFEVFVEDLFLLSALVKFWTSFVVDCVDMYVWEEWYAFPHLCSYVIIVSQNPELL